MNSGLRRNDETCTVRHSGGERDRLCGSSGGTGFINSAFLATPASIDVANGVRSGDGQVIIAAASTPVPFMFSPLPGLVVSSVLSRLRRRKQANRTAATPLQVEA